MNPFQLGAIAKAAEVSLSAALSGSADARECCERLSGKAIAFETLDERVLLRFDGRAVRVVTEPGEAAVTVRGAPSAVLGAMFGRESAVAVLGDAALFEDFRHSFRPHVKLPPAVERLREDASDAVVVGAKAVLTAFESMASAVRENWPEWLYPTYPDSGEMRANVDSLKARVADLEARLRAMEASAATGDGGGAKGEADRNPT